MTQLRRTKSALLTSILALFLSFTMLLGTTYAWFTDSVTSSGNIIQSGTLDIEMYYADGTKAVPDDDSGDWKDATNVAIFNYDKWEPGYVEAHHIKIANVGSLALKYKLSIVAAGDVSKLAEVIDVYYVDPAEQIVDRDSLTDAMKLGSLKDVLANLANTGNGELLAGAKDTITLALKMREDAGNEYQGLGIGSSFSIQLLATQLASEDDSFGKDYDDKATYPNVSAPEQVTVNGDVTEEQVTLQATGANGEAAKVVLPIGVNLGAGVTSVALKHEEPKIEGNKIVFDSFEIVDQDGEIIDLSDTNNAVKITVTLPAQEQFAEGAQVDIFHDGDKVATATVGENGVITYEATHFCEITISALGVSGAEDLAAALTSSSKNINVVLKNDIDLPISTLGQITAGSGEYKLGGDNTETIVIDLNGHKLNITTTYWSAIGAKNNNATITIKNGVMNSTGNSAGTWNAFDLRFSNCNYVFENVTFEKAVALDNASKKSMLKNVTINETHDYYALWITAEGQNVEIDGLIVNCGGRGIKIDEQYVDAPEKVTLKVSNAIFKTVKKAAIMVKSKAGADITLNNVDIEHVTADNINAVWVDSNANEYANLVTVVGGNKINEKEIATVSNDEELAKALSDGKTVIWFGDGTYHMPASAKGKTLTLIGNGNTVIEVVPAGQGEAGGQLDYSLDGSNVAFYNLTIKTNNETYAGYARLTATYNNCKIENQYCLNRSSTFTDCIFNVEGNVYNIWTWGAEEATFVGCTFNSDGKAILLYGTANTKLTIDGCTFNDNGGLTDLKAAIEIGNDYGKSYELIVNNTTVNGYEINDKGINTGTTLWGNKNSMGKDKLNVVVDGVDVY